MRTIRRWLPPRALAKHSPLKPADLCHKAITIAGEIYIYSNTQNAVLELE